MLLILLKLGTTTAIGLVLWLFASIFLEGSRRRKLEQHNNLGDHLGDHIEEGEWEHGE